MYSSYNLATLERAFPSLVPASQKDGGGTRATLGGHVTPELHALIHSPTGKDRSADTLKFAGEAVRSGWRPVQIRAVLLDRGLPISAHCLSQADPDRAADRAIMKAFEDLTAHEPTHEPISFNPSPYVWVPPEEIPPLDWLLGHWLQREEVTFVVAPGASGKTTLLAAAALSLATGRALLGKVVPGGPKRVWLWNLEDSIAMMTRSIQATAKLHDIKSSDLGDRLLLDTARDGTPLSTAKRVQSGLTILEPVHGALVAALRDREIDVLIVDPFVSSHDGNENDNGEMDHVIKDWCRIAQEAKCAVVLCHHTSKAGSAEVNTMSARGAVALTAAARTVLVLNSMTKNEGEGFGVDPDEWWRFVQVAMGKSNRAPPEKADWYCKKSVQLGTPESGDTAGAIEPWSPPRAEDLLTPERIDAIRISFALHGETRASRCRLPSTPICCVPDSPMRFTPQLWAAQGPQSRAIGSGLRNLLAITPT